MINYRPARNRRHLCRREVVPDSNEGLTRGYLYHVGVARTGGVRGELWVNLGMTASGAPVAFRLRPQSGALTPSARPSH